MRNRQIIGVSTSKITKEETVTLILTDKQRQQVCDFSNLVKLSRGGGGEEGGGGAIIACQYSGLRTFLEYLICREDSFITLN